MSSYSSSISAYIPLGFFFFFFFLRKCRRSQNQRIVEDGKQVCLERVSYSRLLSAVSSWILRHSKNEGFTTLGNLFQCPTSLTVKKKKKSILLCSHRTLGLILCSLPLVLSWCITEKNLSVIYTFYYWIFLQEILLSLFFFRLNSPSCLSLSSYERSSRPLITFVTSQWICSSMTINTVELRTGCNTLYASHQCWVEGKEQLPWPAGSGCWQHSPNAAQGVIGFLSYICA